MSPVKAEDLVPHPVKEQFGGVDYCITSPPPWRTPPAFIYPDLIWSLQATAVSSL